MLSVQIKGIGVCGPGIPDWPSFSQLLSKGEHWEPQALDIVSPELLPKNERRRVTKLIKLALQAGTQVTAGSPLGGDTPSVFASSCGDLDITHKICSALQQPGKPVSPTLFHNSVHNAPAGYWSIGTGSQAASISIAVGDASFAAGLLEAASMVKAEAKPVLLIVYDLPTTTPLGEQVDLRYGFACALLLAPIEPGTKMISISLCPVESETVCNNQCLETLRRGNPAARSLTLLQLLATSSQGRIVLPYLYSSCVIEVE